MADTTIYLEIAEQDTVPMPAEGDTIPWCIAMIVRKNLPVDSPDRKGNRPKIKGYYYRYTGGNTDWDDGTPINDGDFEFKLPIKETDPDKGIVEIVFHSRTDDKWLFDDVKELPEGGPLTRQISEDGKTVTITDDLTNTTTTSGNFGCVVKKGEIEIYCDPNWDNR